MVTYILIVLLLLLLLLLGAGLYGIYLLKRAVHKVSMEAFAEESLRRELEKHKAILEHTPKSVAGMTKIYLPQIEKDFPEFSWAEFRQKADNMLKSVLSARDSQDLSYINQASADLKAQIKLEIDGQQRDHVWEHITFVKLHQTEIAHYIKRDGLCVVTLQTSAEHYRYVEDVDSGAIKQGSRERLEQTKYQTELVYIQDPEKITERGTALAVTCPQCGAPVTKLRSKFCEYCDSAILAVNIHVWSIQNIKKII